jgi:hypothetical protein
MKNSITDHISTLLNLSALLSVLATPPLPLSRPGADIMPAWWTPSAEPTSFETQIAADSHRFAPDDPDVWVVRAYFADRQMAQTLIAGREPWEVHLTGDDVGYLVVEVTPAEYERLRAAGFRLEIDQQLTAELRQPRMMLPDQTSGIPGYPCYRTVEETYATAEAIAAAHPTLATWTDIGDSWEKTAPGGSPGYDMMALRLTNTDVPGPKPKLYVMAAAHAREYTTAELVTRFAEQLVAAYGSDADATWLLDYHEIHLLLQANPDGRKQAEAGTSWRKNTNAAYCSPTSSLRGADLNRNFSFQWGCCPGGSSGYPCDSTYRGPSAASEPETQAIQDYYLCSVVLINSLPVIN